MAPKATNSNCSTVDPLTSFLLEFLSESNVEIKAADNYHLLGLSSGKNFARSVSNLTAPYGFKLERTRIVRLDSNGTTIAAKKTTPTAPTANTTADSEDSSAEPATKKAKVMKTKKKSTPKKIATPIEAETKVKAESASDEGEG